MKFEFGTIVAQDAWNVRMMLVCQASLNHRVTVSGFWPDKPGNWWAMILRDEGLLWNIGELITLSPSDKGLRIVEEGSE